MTQTELRIIDDWRRRQPDLPDRADAIRRLFRLGLTAKTAPPKKTACPPARANAGAAAGPWHAFDPEGCYHAPKDAPPPRRPGRPFKGARPPSPAEPG
jgi:hypothetical protein